MTALERQSRLWDLQLPDFCYKVSFEECHHVWEIEAEEAGILNEGYEGIMLRGLNTFYKFGRSTLREQCLLKRKPFKDDEALVVGFIEKEHNDNPIEYNERGLAQRSSAKEGKRLANTLGALRVQHSTFGQFNVGTGFTDEQRKDIWENKEKFLNRLVTFKYQFTHIKNVPCPAIFKAFRT